MYFTIQKAAFLTRMAPVGIVRKNAARIDTLPSRMYEYNTTLLTYREPELKTLIKR